MKKEYKKIILSKKTRDEIITKICEFMSRGICSIDICWGDYNPLTRKSFKHREIKREGRAIAIEKPGPYKNDLINLIRIPIAVPDDGRFFPIGTEFFFKSDDSEIRTKAPVQQMRLKSVKLVKTFEIIKIGLLATIPYRKKDRRIIKLAEKCLDNALSEDAMAML